MSENIEKPEQFVPENLQTAPSRYRPLPRVVGPAFKAASRLFTIALLGVLAMAWAMGLIDPPSRSEAMRKAYDWARDKAPIGSTVRFASENWAFEEGFQGATVRLYVQVPGEREARFVPVHLRQSWRWWVID